MATQTRFNWLYKDAVAALLEANENISVDDAKACWTCERGQNAQRSGNSAPDWDMCAACLGNPYEEQDNLGMHSMEATTSLWRPVWSGQLR